MPKTTPTIDDVKLALKRVKESRNADVAIRVIHSHGFAKSLASIDPINYHAVILRADFLSEYLPPEDFA